MKPLKVKASITLDEDVLEKIKALADEDCRPLSSYINLVLRNHIRRIEAARQKKQQGEPKPSEQK